MRVIAGRQRPTQRRQCERLRTRTRNTNDLLIGEPTQPPLIPSHVVERGTTDDSHHVESARPLRRILPSAVQGIQVWQTRRMASLMVHRLEAPELRDVLSESHRAEDD